jgi:hypothetical protein
MRIHADADADTDPQHCWFPKVEIVTIGVIVRRLVSQLLYNF